MEDIIKKLTEVNEDLLREIGTPSYEIRCKIQDVRDKLKSKSTCNTKDIQSLITIDFFENAKYVYAIKKWYPTCKEVKVGVLLYGYLDTDGEPKYKVVTLNGYDKFNYYLDIDEYDDVEDCDKNGLVFNNKEQEWIKD